MRLGLGIGLTVSRAPSGLDPDAAAYIAAVETAGASVTADQKNAINTFFKTGKSDGWYSSIKRLYLPIWAQAAPNAVDMITRTSGTFDGTVTHSAGYVQGNGSTGYFDFGVSPTTLGLTNSSGCTGSLIKTADTTTGFAFPIGARSASNAGQISSHQNNSATSATGWIGRTSTAGTTESSVLAVSAVNAILLSNRNASGLKTIQRSSTGLIESSVNALEATDPITTQNIYGLAINSSGSPSGYTDAEIGALFVGLGLSNSNVSPFTLALKNLWETASGLTLEGAEYISAITAAGATVTSTQESAIHEFVRTGKSEGWWSSLKRLYLPIWASAAPNAVDMISLTSGSFVPTVTHAAGYVQGDGTSGYFDFGVTPAALGASLSSATIAVLIKTAGSLSGSRTHIATSDIATNSAYLGIANPGGGSIRSAIASYIDSNGYIEYNAGGYTSTNGIVLGGRSSGDRYIRLRKSSGVIDGGTETEPDTGTIPSVRNIYAMAFNYNGTALTFSDAEYGAFVVGTGMSPSVSDQFTLALKDLWETSTGLTLP